MIFVTHGGHEIECLPPDEQAAPQQPDWPAFETGGGRIAAARHWVRSRPAKQRRMFGVLLALGMLLLAATVVVRGQPPDKPPPPAWLVNRPVDAGLSPYLATECVRGGCATSPATPMDLIELRDHVDATFIVGGFRVSDQRRQLRGLSMWVSDDQGSQLYINAVRVTQAPDGWDSAKSTLKDGRTVSRWVVRGRHGLWVVEADASWARNGCGSDRQNATLHRLARQRVRPADLHL